MPYQITTFDDVALPIYNPAQDHTGAEVESSLARGAGGLFDTYGSRRKAGSGQSIKLSGVYEGESLFWTDEAGNFIVDESGNFIIIGGETDNLRDQILTLRAKLGVLGTLYRTLLPGTTRQWVTARLLSVSHPQTTEDRLFKAELSCTFESSMNAWREEAFVTSAISMINGPVALAVAVGGFATVEDAIITIAPSATITSLRVTGNGIDWTWTGSLTAAQTLVIDCGAQTVLKGSVDAYSGFSLGAGHTAQSWLPLAPGTNVLNITANNTGTFTVQHYNQVL